MKRRLSLIAVAVLLVTLLVVASTYAQGGFPDPGTSVTNAVVQNKATGSGEVATLSVGYYDSAGTLIYTNSSVTIDPKAVAEIKTQNEPLPSGQQYSAVISSDRPLASIVSIKNTNVSGAPDTLTQAAYNGTSAPSTELYFPTVWGFSSIASRVTVQNAEGTAATVNFDFYDRTGTYLGQTSKTLAGFAATTIYMGDPTDLPAGWPSGFEDGSITASSTNLLAGASTATWSSRSGAYQSLTANNQGTVLYGSSHYRFRNPSTTPPEYDLFSAINIQNTSATTVADVTVEYYTRGDISGVPKLTIDTTIPALSARGLNTKNGGDLPAATFNPLGTDWDGSVKIISNNGVELVGTGITHWGKTGKSGIYALVSANDGSNVIYVPAQYRLFSTQWNQWSALNLQNIGGSTVAAADLSIEYIDTAGATVATFTGNDLPGDLAPGAALGLNTRNGGDLDASAFNSFGTSFIGGIYVTAPAGSELVGVANIIYSNRASVYNGDPE